MLLDKLLRGAIAGAVVMSLCGGLVAVAQAQSDIVKERHENRKALSAAGREIRKLMQDSSSDLNEIANQANKMAELDKAFATMFPPGSDKDPNSLAAPAIWSDRAGFDAINQRAIDAALKLAALAKEGKRDALSDQYRELGKTCGDCHRAYTTKDPFKQ